MQVKYTITAQNGNQRSTFSGFTDIDFSDNSSVNLSSELSQLMAVKQACPSSWTSSQQKRVNEILAALQSAGQSSGNFETSAINKVIDVLVAQENFSRTDTGSKWFVDPSKLSASKSANMIVVTGAASWG